MTLSNIFEFDVNNAKESKLIFEHDEVDASGLVYSRKRKVLTGVSYTVAKRDMVFFDSWRENIQNILESKFPEDEVGITSFSKMKPKQWLLLIVINQEVATIIITLRPMN